MDRVVLEQVTQGLGVREVVDADELDVGAVALRGADDEAADATEAVDAYAHSHVVLPIVLKGQLTRGMRPIKG